MNKSGWPLPKRTELINRVKQEKGKASYPLKFQDRIQQFEVYLVDIAMPKYRLANGRTQAAQEEYLATHSELSPDFFSIDSESEEAQNAQHSILKRMIRGAGLLDYFKDNKQEEPLILTEHGFVVNGNRRLCAYRELLAEDPVAYQHFSHIEVIILLPCSEKDIDELEADLQIKNDLKQKYNWITKACMLRKRRTLHDYTDEDLARLYGTKPAEIRNSLTLLSYADTYLEKLGKAKQYHLVEDHEYAFKQMKKYREKYSDEADKELYTTVCQRLISGENGQIDGRLYQRMTDVYKHFDVIKNRLSEQYKKEIHPEKGKSKYSILGKVKENPSTELVQLMNSKTQKNELVALVTDVVEGENTRVRKQQEASAVFNKIRDANTSLNEALSFIKEDTMKDGISEQLVSIEELISQIKEWINGNA